MTDIPPWMIRQIEEERRRHNDGGRIQPEIVPPLLPDPDAEMPTESSIDDPERGSGYVDENGDWHDEFDTQGLGGNVSDKATELLDDVEEVTASRGDSDAGEWESVAEEIMGRMWKALE